MALQTTNFGKRIEIIDVLRGFALFGIIVIHMIEQYYAGQPPQGIETPTVADSIAQGFSGIFIMGKFFMIFSFLFGLSFHIQFSKRDEDSNFLIRFAWRLIILFVIGMIHHLHYRGDILSIYAVLGFALLIFYRLPDHALLIIAVLLVLNVPSLITRSVQAFLPGDHNIFDQDPKALTAYYETVKHGTYVDILKANYNSFDDKMQFQVWSGRIYITLGLFLLGVYAGRKRFFENIAEKISLLKKFRNFSLWTLLGAVIFGAAFFGGAFAAGIKLSDQVNLTVGFLVMDVSNAALAVIYVVGVMLLFQRERWNRVLMYLYPVGKMGLTTYLMQTLFGTMIFFSYGLGLIYELGAFYSMLIGLALFVVQVGFANLWFRYFAYGPIEWLWRNLTYFRYQPISIPKSQAA